MAKKIDFDEARKDEDYFAARRQRYPLGIDHGCVMKNKGKNQIELGFHAVSI